MTERLNLAVDNGTVDMLAELAGGKRKMGGYVSQIVRELHAGSRAIIGSTQLDRIEMTLVGVSASVRDLEGRVSSLERNVTGDLERN